MEKGLSYLSLIFLQLVSKIAVSEQATPYRIEGGVPAGISIIPSVSGVLMKSTDMSPKTRHGNKRTMPSGIETDELPLRRMRRRKKPIRGGIFSARRGGSLVFSTLSFEEGILRPTS